MKRLCLGLVLLGVAGAASAQQLGSFTDSPACCQLTTSLVQDVVYGKDTPPDEQLFSDTTPPNLHFILDTSGSMRELPQIVNGRHSEFFDLTVNGCENPRLDAFQLSRGWDPATVYPVPDTGTGIGSDYGFPDLFQDDKFYGYMYWGDLSDPSPQWNVKEHACQSQVPNWPTNPSEYARCLTCLSTKGYYKVPGAEGEDSAPMTNPDFIFWGRFLNFNPPKYVTAKVVLKSIIKDLKRVRVGMSTFSNTSPNSTLLRGQSPSCSQTLSDSSAFDVYRASYINSINGLTFTTGTPLARTLLNVGYYFSSSDTIYRNVFGFGSGYSYPASYKNPTLTSQSRSVCWGCQSSSVILITDGEPSSDSLTSTVVTKLRTVNGGPVYCPDSQPCGSGTTSGRDKGSSPGSYLDDNPNYYLDDVAKLLYEQDLQSNSPPIVGDFDTSGKQSLRVYTVGFGINSNLLRNTAEVGGGLYYTADDAPSLKQALLDIVSSSSTQMRSVGFTTSSVDSQPVGAQASALLPRIKLPMNPSKPWQGALYRFQLAEEKKLGCNPLYPYTGDLNQDGDCDDTLLLDAHGDAVIESASGAFVKLLSPLTPAQPFWEAGQVLKPSGPSPSQQWLGRRIFTIVDTNWDGKIDRRDTPVAFTEANAYLLRDYLGISQNPTGCADLAARLGVPSLTPDDCTKLVIRWYRGADAFNPDPSLRSYDRPFLLQDIFHSTPIHVEPPQPKDSCASSAQCLPALFRGSTALDGYSVPVPPGYVDAYEKYAFEAGDRDKIVLAGSNGGMLHAFLNGRSTGSVDPSTGRLLHDPGTGQELWAFIPPDLLPRLRNNLDKHAYFVDGTAMVRDVWLDGAEGPADGRKQWQEYRTVAVVGTGRGGVHRFALDLTRLLGVQPGDTAGRVPNQAGDFLWMWPQPCDALALKVGESFSHFAPQPPPIGPVALTPGADDALRALTGTGGGGVATPWWVDATPARERWVVALNGGYDPHNVRGRGMALVDLTSGHTVWSFFHEDYKGRSQHLRYSIAAGLALADVGSAQGVRDSDELFDTATVGDYGGQLWAVRFWKPGQWDATTQQVSNWHAARAFRVENLAGRTGSPEALRGPFSQIATNVVQPDTGFLRTFLGTGDSQNLRDTAARCRLGNLRACAEQGCGSQAVLEIQRAGALASAATTTYSNFALSSADSFQGSSGPSCAGARVRLSWNNDAANGCGNGHDGSIEYTCDGSPSTWSCRETQNTWAVLNYTAGWNPNTQRFYGVWSYGGPPSRRFNTDAEAELFDSQLFTDADLVSVGQFSTTGRVVEPQVDASPQGSGWYISYSFETERTGSAATLIDGCLLWSSFEPSSGNAAVCSATGRNTARLYQADPVSGRASCAAGFYEPVSGDWSRFRASGTQVNLGDPAPQRWVYDAEVHTRAILSTPPGSTTSGTPFSSVPVSEGPP
ncbi:pilus assembly protein PilY [Hyalangium sp.]|uniref:pilus assembly protein PilY n=1 Tax=Hyalangium sp. TaxID=2028555 RepID=UPI002D2F961A|nr:pilus assembly protein PilY [Hyalangium sp.]HYH99380.1 pilus assembly protein PilY [Hyalangium sp.]